MEEENKTVSPEEEQKEEKQEALLAGKFKSVDALLRAYGELEAEFTRRSQRLKALEGTPPKETQAAHGEPARAFTKDDLKEAVGEYFDSLRGVPLMGMGGSGVVAPPQKPTSIAEAGNLALGYLKRQRS